MFRRTTITMTLAAIATVAANLQAPVFAAEPSAEPIVTETPGLPGLDSFTTATPTLEDALADYLAGLGPEEGDFGGPAEVVLLPDDVMNAIMDSLVDLPGVGELPPLTVDDTEPPIDEPVCGEPGGICDEPDEGAELPLDPSDTCGEDGVACEFDPTADDHPWDVPVADDGGIPFDDHGWGESGGDEAPSGTPVGTESRVNPPADASEGGVTTTTVASGAPTTHDSVDSVNPDTSETVGEVASASIVTAGEGAQEGIDPAMAAVAGILAVMAVAGLGYGAFRIGRRGA